MLTKMFFENGHFLVLGGPLNMECTYLGSFGDPLRWDKGGKVKMGKSKIDKQRGSMTWTRKDGQRWTSKYGQRWTSEDGTPVAEYD